MYIHEALSKSRHITHPHINGIIVESVDCFQIGFVRLYLDDENDQYCTSEFALKTSLLTSDEWVPVKVNLEITEITN